MNVNDIATKQDIATLQQDLQKIIDLLGTPTKDKKILRSADVRMLLNISDGTLQRLRISGILPANKINGTWFYDYADILKLLEK